MRGGISEDKTFIFLVLTDNNLLFVQNNSNNIVNNCNLYKSGNDRIDTRNKRKKSGIFHYYMVLELFVKWREVT